MPDSEGGVSVSSSQLSSSHEEIRGGLMTPHMKFASDIAALDKKDKELVGGQSQSTCISVCSSSCSDCNPQCQKCSLIPRRVSLRGGESLGMRMHTILHPSANSWISASISLILCYCLPFRVESYAIVYISARTVTGGPEPGAGHNARYTRE